MTLLHEEKEQFRQLLEQLPAVINVHLKTDESGKLTEIHVLAGEERTPKQIARDICSAIAAKFSLEIDHKIISVAQVPTSEFTSKNDVRLKYSGLNFSMSLEECNLCVSLEYGGHYFLGKEKSEVSKTSRYKAIACATVKAVNKFLNEKAVITLEDLRMSEVNGQTVIIVTVLFKTQNRIDLLVGSCFETDDGGASAVKATLDAVNRRINAL